MRLTQAVKRRDRRGRLRRVEVRAAIGPPLAQPHPVRVARLNGALRDRLDCLTRRTPAFAKTAATRDALVGLAVFEHNRLRPHVALRAPVVAPVGRDDRRTPAMAIGLTDHRRSWAEFLTAHVPLSS